MRWWGCTGSDVTARPPAAAPHPPHSWHFQLLQVYGLHWDPYCVLIEEEGLDVRNPTSGNCFLVGPTFHSQQHGAQSLSLHHDDIWNGLYEQLGRPHRGSLHMITAIRDKYGRQDTPKWHRWSNIIRLNDVCNSASRTPMALWTFDIVQPKDAKASEPGGMEDIDRAAVIMTQPDSRKNTYKFCCLGHPGSTLVRADLACEPLRNGKPIHCRGLKAPVANCMLPERLGIPPTTTLGYSHTFLLIPFIRSICLQFTRLVSYPTGGTMIVLCRMTAQGGNQRHIYITAVALAYHHNCVSYCCAANTDRPHGGGHEGITGLCVMGGFVQVYVQETSA